MKIKNIYKIVLSAAVAVFMTGCIEETYPTDYVLSSQIADSENALSAMVNSIYTTIAGWENYTDASISMIGYNGMRLMLEHSTTPLVCTGANGSNTCAVWCTGESADATTSRGKIPSYYYYGQIKTANDVIGMIDPDDMSDTEKHYLGIALAYRALEYTDLVQIMEYKYPTDSRYSFVAPENDLHNLGLPIVTEKTTSQDATNNPRATVDEVYDLILSDLTRAEEYLSDFNRTDKIEPNLACIYGQMARVYVNIASRVNTSVTYKDEATYWKLAEEYAKQAIELSGCTPLTEEQWTDPIDGFNNRNSQNSWLWALTINENSTFDSSFPFTMLMGNETTYSSYGWKVGRSLDRKMYERLSDNDWRKKSWLCPQFFYLSENQEEGEPYLIEQDSDGNFVNNKWGDSWTSTTQGEWSDEAPDGTDYSLVTSPSFIRSRINYSNGYQAWPWLYITIKFRPHNGLYNDYLAGTATDYPILRVEELHYLLAEIALHTQGVSAASALLQEIVGTRNSGYTFTASSEEDFMDEYCFQKAIEFWGEGVNYFDSKRLELGIHRAYLGTSCERYQHALDMEEIFTGWTPGFNQAEVTGNMGVYHYDNPYTNPSTFRPYKSNDEYRPYYGCDLDDPKPQSEWVKIVE